MTDRVFAARRFEFLHRRRRIVQLERAVAKRDQALRTVRDHARSIELKAASFGLDRILDPRLSEIERHALDARLVADHITDEGSS